VTGECSRSGVLLLEYLEDYALAVCRSHGKLEIDRFHRFS
jgi:hypothetical protein